MSRVLFAIGWISVGSTLAMACYFLFGITRLVSVIGIVMSAVIAWFIVRQIEVPAATPTQLPPAENSRMGWNLKMIVLVWAYVPIAFLRTGEAVVTPWHAAGVVFFALLLYGVETWYVLRRGNRERRIVLLLHGFVTFGLAQYVFVHGYGFDPVVHEAALREVVAQGQVQPVQFLYSAYYAVLAAIHFVTTIPVALVSVWVVPFAAALVQALVAPWAFQVAWGASASTARRAAVLLSIVSVPVFILSTPWSASVLLALVAVLLAPLLERRTVWIVLFFVLLLLAILALHPLMGLSVIGAFGIVAACQTRGRVVVPLAALATIAAIVGLFGWLRIRAGVPFFEYATSLPDAVFAIANTYGVRLLFIGAALVLLARSRAWIPEIYRRLVAGLSVGMIVSAVVLWTIMPAPQVGSTDQLEYAWRLLLAVLVLLSPLLAVTIARWKDRSWYWAVCAAALTLSWFGMYPMPWSVQHVVTDADVRVARTLPAGVVLSDQVFAQAGLRVEGFPSRYPVDAGSDGAVRSELLLHQSVADAIQGLADPILVVHTYWYRAQDIDREALAAGMERVMEDGVVRVYGVVNAAPVR